MKEERSGAPDSARLFDASRARAGASTGVPAPTRVVCSGHTHTGIINQTTRTRARRQGGGSSPRRRSPRGASGYSRTVWKTP